MRGFVMENTFEDESDLKSKIREEMIQKLASEWNVINKKLESLSWRERDEIADESEFHSEIAEEAAANEIAFALKNNPNLSDEEQKEIGEKAKDSYYAEVDKKANEPVLRMEVIEELLADLGARMMRPYEHWNEDERYMEYMENRFECYDDY
jgi:hypothetical protein